MIPIDRKRLWIGWLPLGVPFVLAVIFGFAWLHHQIRPYENNEVASTTWSVSGTPFVFSCVVLDEAGQPVRGARISFLSESGWTATCESDEDGMVDVRSGESDMQGIMVNGKQIVTRGAADFLGQPNVARGLSVKIILKTQASQGGV